MAENITEEVSEEGGMGLAETLAFNFMGEGGLIGENGLIAEGGLMEAAETVTRIKMYPYFEIAHYLLVCIMVREDLYSTHIAGPKGFHRNHPLACWVGSMMLCFAPSIFSNFLLGEPLLHLSRDELHVTVASTVWYLVNYCPLDIVYQFIKFLPVQVVLLGMEEVLRLSIISEGSNFAFVNFRGAFYFICFFGALKGTAVLHLRLLQRLICGKWMPYHIEVLEPSPISKVALLAGVCFSLHHTEIIHTSYNILYFVLLLVFLVVKFFWSAFGVDIFKLVENIMCFVLFGGFLGWLDRRRHRKEYEHLGQDFAKGKKYK